MLPPPSPMIAVTRLSSPGESGNRDAQTGHASLADQIAHQHGREQPLVDVAATENQADPLAGEAPRIGQQGGEPGGPGALGESFLDREQEAERLLDLRLVDQEDLIDQVAGQPGRQISHPCDADAFGDGRPATGQVVARQAVPHGRDRERLRPQ